MEKLAENDLFVTALVEYSVGATSENNGWKTLIKCLLSEYSAQMPTYDEARMFLRTQEHLYKNGGGTLPTAYRSAKSTLLSAIKYGVLITEDVAKSELYIKTKVAKDALADVPDKYEVFSRKLAAVRGAFLNLDSEDEGRAFDEVRATFEI